MVYLSGLAYSYCSGKEAVKWVSVYQMHTKDLAKKTWKILKFYGTETARVALHLESLYCIICLQVK